MKNQPAIVVVLVAMALVLGGLLAWITTPSGESAADPVDDRTASVSSLTEELELPPPDPSEIEIPLAERGVERYLAERWGEERAKDLLNAPGATQDGRPLYHSKTVIVSVDRDGTPRFVKPSWSPLDPTGIKVLDKKELDRDQIGSGVGLQMRADSPEVQQYLAQSKARSNKAQLLAKWANQQVEQGAVGEGGVPALPEDLDGVLKKMAAQQLKGGKKKNGGQGGAPKKAGGAKSGQGQGAGAEQGG